MSALPDDERKPLPDHSDEEDEPLWMTLEQYLDYDAANDFRSEFYASDDGPFGLVIRVGAPSPRLGRVYAMTGGSQQHSLIATNILGLLYTQLRKTPCRVYNSDMAVATSPHSSRIYPDVTVVCGEPEIYTDKGDRILNPALIIEVPSPSSERRDRGEKFARYRYIESVQAYVIVSQERAQIEHYTRTENGWLMTEATGLDGEIALPTIGCTLTLADVYDGVQFEKHGPNATAAEPPPTSAP